MGKRGPWSNQEITPNDKRILLTASSESGITQVKILRLTGMSQGSVSFSVRKLASKGYMTLFSIDNRRKGILLTNKGISKVKELETQDLVK